MPSQLWIDPFALGVLRMLDAGHRKGTFEEVSQAVMVGTSPNFFNLNAQWSPKLPDILLDRNILINHGSWTISGPDVPEPRPKRVCKPVDRLVL
jgi:hypothetical protein